MPHRLFAAVIPPPEVVEALAAHLAPRRDTDSRLRWTDPHQWHVTLAFMPQVEEHLLEPLADALADVAATHPVGSLLLDGAGCFPAPERARVLWAGVRGDSPGLAALARSVRMTCAHEGADPEGGPFRAHVTLARARPFEATQWLRALSTLRTPEWVPQEVSLVASRLGAGRQGRPVYETLASLPLG